MATDSATPTTTPFLYHEPDLERRPGYLVKRLSTTMRSRMDESLRPLGLTVPQYVCMKALYDTPGVSGAEIARRAFVSRQSVHQLLFELRARGGVEQEPSTNGLRRGVARLTEEGLANIEAALAPVDALEETMLSALSDEERILFNDMLLRCEAAVKDHSG